MPRDPRQFSSPAAEAVSVAVDAPYRAMRAREGARILAASRVFADLDAAELERLASRSTVRRLRRGEALTRHGDTVDWLAVVGKGRLKVVMPGTEDFPGLLLGLVLPGDVIGEIGIFENVPRAAGHSAVIDSEVLLVPKAELLALLDRRPVVTRRLLELCATKLRLSLELGLALRSMDLPSRLHGRFLYLAQATGQLEENGLRIQHGLSHQELADSVAASRESLSRLMGEWRDAMLISYGRGYVLIHDPEALAQRLKPDPLFTGD